MVTDGNDRGEAIRPFFLQIIDRMNDSVQNLIKPFEFLPQEVIEYSVPCFEEHLEIISHLLGLGYEPDEVFFRDYLSGPKNVISGNDPASLLEALRDIRYELVPVVRFANRKLENPKDNVSETSALIIEFHKRGMAF